MMLTVYQLCQNPQYKKKLEKILKGSSYDIKKQAVFDFVRVMGIEKQEAINLLDDVVSTYQAELYFGRTQL